MKVRDIWVFTFVNRQTLVVTPPFLCHAYSREHAERILRQHLSKDSWDVNKAMRVINKDFVCVPSHATIDFNQLLL